MFLGAKINSLFYIASDLCNFLSMFNNKSCAIYISIGYYQKSSISL